MIGAAGGYRVRLCVPANVDGGIVATLAAYLAPAPGLRRDRPA